MKTAISDMEGLLRAIRDRYVLDWHGTHGWEHWKRVYQKGRILAAEGGADVRVVELFSFLHDSCRESDGFDPQHGPRAAVFTGELHGVFFRLGKKALDTLLLAINDHTMGYVHHDPTIRVCWDADRLDLPRVGTRPDPRYFGTRAAVEILKSGTGD